MSVDVVVFVVCQQPQASSSNVPDTNVDIDDVPDFLASDGTDPSYVTFDSIPADPLATNVFLLMLLFVANHYVICIFTYFSSCIVG